MNLAELASVGRLALSAAVLALAAGCAENPGKVSVLNKEAQQFAANSDPRLQPLLAALYQGGERGAVLNFDQLGLAAMQIGDTELAKRSFDQSIARIEAIYADDPNARKAKSVFSEEKVKDFKGEPYERAMVYYYRGVLYAHEGDYENARASFLAADRHIALSLNENYESDFGAMKYLAGWSAYCNGDASSAGELIKQAQAKDKLATGWPVRPGNSIVLIDSGRGPIKVGEGKYRELLKFRPGPSVDDGIITVSSPTGARFDGQYLIGDVVYQAMNRGGRPVDAIMAGKATFKDNMGTARDVALTAGVAMTTAGMLSDNSNLAAAGLAGSLIGLAFSIAESSAKPAADVRAWSSLPGQLVMFSNDAKANGEIRLSWKDQPQPAPLPVQGTHGRCSIAWGKTQSALSPKDGGTAAVRQDNAHDGGASEKNKAFRAMLVDEFTPQVVTR
jgi:tetratricopeptide (TPR) repeat protein